MDPTEIPKNSYTLGFKTEVMLLAGNQLYNQHSGSSSAVLAKHNNI